MVRWPWVGGLALTTAALLGQTSGADGATALVDDARILSVEVNQGSGNEYQALLTKGAPTVVRVLADASHGSVPVFIVLHGYHHDASGDTELPTSPLTPNSKVAAITLGSLFGPTETQFLLPSSWTTGGDLVLNAELLPQHTYVSSGAECLPSYCRSNNSDATAVLHFVDTGVIRLHEVSETGLLNDSGAPGTIPSSVDGVLSDIQAVLPFGSGNLHFARSGEVDLSDLNGTVPRSQIPLLQCFSDRQTKCPKGPDADGDGTIDSTDPNYVSDQSIVFTGQARLDVLTAGERCNGSTLHVKCFDDALGMTPNVSSGRDMFQIGPELEARQQVGVNDRGGRGTVHELSHALGRDHINAGTGCVSDDLGSPTGVDPGWPYPDNVLHTTGVDTRQPIGGGAFRVVNTTVAHPVYEVMSYCHADDTHAPLPGDTDWWVSDYGRDLATNFLADLVGPGTHQAVTGVHIRAQFDGNGGIAQGAYLFPAIDVPLEPTQAGTKVTVTAIDGSTYTAPVHVAGATIYGFVPMPFVNGAPRVGGVVLNPSGLGILSASANAPTIRTFNVTRNVVTKTYRATWNASDADGDALLAAIDYSTDGLSWRTLWVGPSLNPHMQPFKFADLPYSLRPRFRLRVADDTQWTTANVALTGVTELADLPRVYIGDPTKHLWVNQGNAFTLTGSATDQFLVSLTGDQLRWTHNGQYLGSGSLLDARFMGSGNPVVKLTATDNNPAPHSQFATSTIYVRNTSPLLVNLRAYVTGTNALLTFTPTLPGKLYPTVPGAVLPPQTFTTALTAVHVPLPPGVGDVDVKLRITNSTGTATSYLTVTFDRSTVLPPDLPPDLPH